MRLVGPNCLGVVNTAAGVRLNATFAPRMPEPGNVGFISQSGALGLAFIELSGDRNLGLSSFASVGNRADITANDLLEYWESDPGTDVALLYIESFSDPRRFSRVAPRVGRAKPIVVVKSGRSAAGARATSSHTGAMLAASDVTVDALFQQAGVIRTDSLAEMLDVASLLANQPLPEGPPRRHADQRRRPGDHVRGRLRGLGARASAPPDADPGAAARVPAARGVARQSGRHDRDRNRGAVPGGDRDAGGLGRHRRADRDLRAAAADQGRGRRRGGDGGGAGAAEARSRCRRCSCRPRTAPR